MSEAVKRQSVVFGKILYFFAGYTLMIKYVLPVSWALIQKAPLAAYIYFWDAWWIAHLAVGRGLIAGKKGIWCWALLLAAAEIIIITVKFVSYLKAPDLDFWHVNWFVNKSLMLIYFWGLLVWLFKKETRELL